MSFIRVPKRVSRGKMLHTMSKSAAWVLIAMADCLESKDDCGRVSVPKLREITGLSRRAVQVGLSELVKSGLIERNQLTGQYRFLPENAGAQPCAGAHGDAHGGAPSCAGGRTVVRGGAHGDAQTVGRNKDRPRTYNQEPIHQEGVCVPSVPYPHRENGTIPVREAAERLFDSVGWPKARRGGEGGVRMLSMAILRIADGWHDEEAASDPVTWIQCRMMEKVRDADSEKFVPLITNWIKDEYPHLAQQEQPA